MSTIEEASGNGGGRNGSGPEPVLSRKLTDESIAIETNRVVKDAPGRVFSVMGYSGRSSEQWIQLHDATSLPSDTAIPKYSVKVPAASNFSFEIDEEDGDAFTSGIVVCNSTTHATKTIGSADTMFNILYI